MNKIRYSDEKYLCAYDLDIDLFKQFDVEVEDLIPLRSIYILFTDKGKKILKKIQDVDDMEFITKSLDYIREGYSDILSFEKAGDGNYYVRWKDGIYCMMELIEGRECCCSNPLDVSLATRALAKYHEASLGLIDHLKQEEVKGLKNNLGRFPDKFLKAKVELLSIKEIVEGYGFKNKFDELFLNTVNEQIKSMDEAIEKLNNSKYEKLCNDKSKVVFCHNDLAHHNIIMAEDKTYFIDFEYALIDIRVHDICNFLIKSIKNYGYDFDKCKEIIKIYNSVWSIDREELDVLYGLMVFPNDYYNLVSNYYSKKKNWTYESFLSKFQNKLEDENDRKDFLELFKIKILK